MKETPVGHKRGEYLASSRVTARARGFLVTITPSLKFFLSILKIKGPKEVDCELLMVKRAAY